MGTVVQVGNTSVEFGFLVAVFNKIQAPTSHDPIYKHIEYFDIHEELLYSLYPLSNEPDKKELYHALTIAFLSRIGDYISTDKIDYNLKGD